MVIYKAAAARDGQPRSRKTSKSSRTSAPSLTEGKVSTASSKSSKASEKTVPVGKGASSDTKRKPSEATSSKTSSRRSVTTTNKAVTNTDDAKKSVESRPTMKSAATRKLSSGAATAVGEAGSPHQVSPKALHKSTDGHKTKDQRDATEEGLEKKALSKAHQGDGTAVDQSMKDDGNRSVKNKSGSQSILTLIKSRSMSVLNVAGSALAGRGTPKSPLGKSKTPAESAGPGKVEMSDARASLARLAAMHEESGHSELDSQQQRFLALGGALSLTLLMIIFFSVVSYILRGGAPTIPVACETPECAAAKAYVEGLLGDPKLRCVDFYSYVCGQMITNHMSASAAALERLHHRLMRDKEKTPDWQGGHVAARVYSGCQAFLDMSETPVSTMQEAARTIKSDVLRGANTYAQIITVLVSVSLQRGLHTVLEVGLVRYTERSPVSLRLSPGRSIQRKFTKDNPKDLEQNLKTAFAWAPEVHTTEALNVVLTVDKHIEEAFATSDGVGDGQEENGPFHSFVRDMTPAVVTEVWVSAVTATNPDSFIASAETPCFASALSSVRNAFRLLDRVGVHSAASYLAVNLEAEIAVFEYARQNLSSNADAKRRFCLDATRRSMPSAWHPLAATILKTSGRDGEVKHMFGALRHVFGNGERGALFTWLDPTVRTAVMKRLDEITVTVIGSEDESKRSAMNYADFTPTMTEAKDFVDGYLNTLRHTLKIQTAAPPSRWQVLYADMELIGTVVYDPRLRSIVVPPVLMTEPYFYDNALPMHFDYGTVGALLAVRTAQIFSAEALQADNKTTRALGRQGDPPVANASNTFNQSAQCIRKLRKRLDPAFASDSVREDVLLAWMQATQVLFFARFCLLSCSGIQRRHTGDSHVPPRERCLLPLHNLPQFAEVFECAGNKDFVAGECQL
ncbi:hypothetical protein MTO96_017699 [Rhipicephalus appendiculatus]